MIPELRTACAGFLVAVLVGDLTFDLPVLRARDVAAAARALDAATRYYARITARRSPLVIAVAVVMAVLLAVVARDLVPAPGRDFRSSALATALASLPIALALLRTFPNAKRLAAGDGDLETRAALARRIAREHLLALAAMGAYLVGQIIAPGD